VRVQLDDVCVVIESAPRRAGGAAAPGEIPPPLGKNSEEQ